MKDTLNALVEVLLKLCPEDGYFTAPVPGIRYMKVSEPSKHSKRQWHASIGFVIQGSKEVVIGNTAYHCDAGGYTATPLQLPVISRVSGASKEKPFLAILVGLDPTVLMEVGESFKERTAEKVCPRPMFVGETVPEMLEAGLRLARLFSRPEDAKALGPLIVREMVYHLLKGSEGAAIQQFIRSGSKAHKITRAIFQIRVGLKEEIDVENLAREANMSRSAFFKHFKEATSMSPIQYQKRLRLLEARRMMVEEGETAESSAFRVGYLSASQFSREYARMFGDSPIKDTKKLKVGDLT